MEDDQEKLNKKITVENVNRGCIPLFEIFMITLFSIFFVCNVLNRVVLDLLQIFR